MRRRTWNRFPYTSHIVACIPKMFSRLIMLTRVQGIHPSRCQRTVDWYLSGLGLYIQRRSRQNVYLLTCRVRNPGHAVTFRVKTMPVPQNGKLTLKISRCRMGILFAFQVNMSWTTYSQFNARLSIWRKWCLRRKDDA